MYFSRNVCDLLIFDRNRLRTITTVTLKVNSVHCLLTPMSLQVLLSWCRKLQYKQMTL